MQRLLVDIGTQVDERRASAVAPAYAARSFCPEAPYELVKTMRASSLVLGPLVARSGARAFPARRLRHRRAAHQPAHFRPGTSGREDQPGARVYRSGSARRVARRRGQLRTHHRHRNRRPDDGGGSRQGRNGAAQCRARAGGRRSGGAADEDGREDRGRGHNRDSHSGRGEVERRRPHDYCRPHRGRHLRGRRGHHGRRGHRYRLRARAPGGACVEAATGRHRGDTDRQRLARARQRQDSIRWI